MSIKESTFWADAAKGHIIKVLFDSFASIPRGSFSLRKEGIFFRNSDEHHAILFDNVLERANFRTYRCLEPKTISINLKHLQKVLRNVKKKDSVTLFITRDEPSFLQLKVKPEGAGASKKTNVRSEINKIIFQEEATYDPLGLPEGGYEHPMIIEATDFQKVKRLLSLGKVINVRMQKNNYLSFYSDACNIYTSALEYGEIFDAKDVEPSDVDGGALPGSCDDEVITWFSDENDEPIDIDDVNDDADEGGANASSQGDGEEAGFYEASFHTSFFAMLVKLPGLGTQMQFYAPRIPQFPLRIKMHAGTLGPLQVYIKDAKQLTFEQSLRQEQETKIAGVTKKRRKTASNAAAQHAEEHAD